MNDYCLTSKSAELYEIDFAQWTIEQTKLLREEKWNCLDIANLLEEIEEKVFYKKSLSFLTIVECRF